MDSNRGAVSIEPTVEALVNTGIDDSKARDIAEGFVRSQPDLLTWWEQNGREFPWRQSRDSWEILVAEILLQRTRAEAVESVYKEFVERFPEPEALSQSPSEEIRKLVDELGFGSQRTRTLQDVAGTITTEHGGTVPTDPDKLENIWRIGPYSARATALFAHGKPVTLVDSNIARFFERQFDFEMPAQPHKDEQVERLVSGVTPTDPDLARAFYLAILDLAAHVCTPEEPRCTRCPVRDSCSHARDG